VNFSEIRQSARTHLTSNDVVGLIFSSTLLGALPYAIAGNALPKPLGMPVALVLILVAACIGVIYFAGVKARNDLTSHRLAWELGVLIPASALLGWITANRTDVFFTATTLFEVSTLLLVLSILAGLSERRAARGTPSDVMARATSSTALLALVCFWVFMAAALQPIAAIFMLLAAILIAFTLVLRLPGVLVPIYRGTWRRRRRSSTQAP
jgi:hypothetical protein